MNGLEVQEISQTDALIERRLSRRYQTVLRVGVVVTETGPQLCVVRNLSAQGLQAKVYRPIPPGERVSVRLREDGALAGSVIWNKAELIGIRFDTVLTGTSFLQALGYDERRRPRVPRIPVICSGMLRIGGRNYRASLSDISPRGAGLTLSEAPDDQGDVCLSLPGLDPIAAQIRWTAGPALGLLFNEVLPVPTLADWITRTSSRSAVSADRK